MSVTPAGKLGQQSGDHQLEVNSGRGCARHSGQGRVDDIGRARERRSAVQSSETVHAGDFVRGDSAQNRRRSVAGRVDDHEVAQTFEDVFDEASRVVSGLDDSIDCPKGVSGIATPDRIDALVEKFAWCVTEQVVGSVPSDGVVVRARNDLVEQ